MEEVRQKKVVFLVLDLNQEYPLFKRPLLPKLVAQTYPREHLRLAPTPIPEFNLFLVEALLAEESERSPELLDLAKLSDFWKFVNQEFI